MKRSLFLLLQVLVCLAVLAGPALADDGKLTQKIRKLDDKISSLDNQLAQLNARAASLTRYLDTLSAEEDALRTRLASDITSFNTAARDMVRMERLPVEALLVTDALRAQHQRRGILGRARADLTDRIHHSRDRLHELGQLRQTKSNALLQLTKSHTDIAKGRNKLSDALEEQLALLKVSDAKQAQMVRASLKMQQAPNLDAILKQRDVAALRARLPRLRTLAGQLPVDGEVVAGFHDKDATGLTSQGLRIVATPGADVVALADGRVIYSGPFRTHGKLVIVEHEDQAHTLYSGLDTTAHAVGDVVRAGDRLGRMPATARPKFYLEVRAGGRPVNPVSWLKRQGE